MNNAGRWIAGFAVQFSSGDMQGIWIIRRVNGSNVTFADIEGSSVVSRPVDKLEEDIESGNVHFLAESRYNGEIVLQNLAEKDQIETARKYAYVKAYLESEEKKRSRKKLEIIISKAAKEMGDHKPPSWNTFNGWLKQYMNAGNKLRGLYPNHYKKGNRTQKLDDRVYKIIQSVKPFYYKKGQVIMSTIYRMVEAKILEHNLENPSDMLNVPSFSTVKYQVMKASYQEFVRGRVGRKQAKYEFSNVGEPPKTSQILERVEADHTPLDINVLHDDRKTLLGRPTLTILIDHYSRMVMGFQVSFEEPSYASASMAISCAILPKESVLEFYGVQGCWPACGIMESMVADNGSEFWSDNMDLAIGELGSVLQYAPVRSPNYKGVVERFFRTLRTMLIDALPGKTNGVGNGSDEYNAQSEAKLSLTEFKKIFLNWLVNIYHLEPTGGSVKSPLDLWNESARTLPEVELNPKRIETILMASDTRTLHRDGIQFEKLNYNSNSLKDIYRREGTTSLTIKYSPFNIGYIYVYDVLNRIYIQVPCVDYEYAKNLSLYAHKIIRKHASAKRKVYQDNAVLQKAKVEIFANIEALHEKNVRRKSQVTAKKAARIEGSGVPVLPTVHTEPEPILVQNNLSQEELDDWEIW